MNIEELDQRLNRLEMRQKLILGNQKTIIEFCNADRIVRKKISSQLGYSPKPFLWVALVALGFGFLLTLV